MKKEDVEVGEVYRIRDWDDMKEEYGIDDGRLNMPFYKISKDVKQFCGESVRAVDYHDGLFKLFFLRINDNVPYLWLPGNILEPLKASSPFPEPEVKDYNTYVDTDDTLEYFSEIIKSLDELELGDGCFTIPYEDIYYGYLEDLSSKEEEKIVYVRNRQEYDNLMKILEFLDYGFSARKHKPTEYRAWDQCDYDEIYININTENKRLSWYNSDEYKFYRRVLENPGELLFYKEFCDKIINGQLFEADKVKIKNIINQKQKPMLQKLTDALKKHLPGSIQKQYKANLRDGDLELTGKGRELLLEILADEYEDKLTEKAEEIIKEVEEE